MTINDLTIVNALEKLNQQNEQTYVSLFNHGSLEIEIYAPKGEDLQQPHDKDEVYIIASGSGWFVNGEVRHPFEPGQILFVPAGVVHRFEDFTDDFSTWVIFYGPQGGENNE